MILETIDSDFKNAMRAKNELEVSALRIVKSEIKNSEIEKKGPLTDDEVLKVIGKKVKQHKDSIESFKAGGRQDLVDHEQKQMEVLMRYLPKQMGEDDVRALVKAVVAETNATSADFGKVMKEVLTRAKGQTDGSVVSKIAKEELS
ncbi:MAG: GatB/YqeY domain-containing protein [Candidatus Doudnabacteria bacterium]|nr:GatB/YqeY domain-containing protein [Candidatus Doudnabacteria bacterium]